MASRVKKIGDLFSKGPSQAQQVIKSVPNKPPFNKWLMTQAQEEAFRAGKEAKMMRRLAAVRSIDPGKVTGGAKSIKRRGKTHKKNKNNKNNKTHKNKKSNK